MQAFRVIAPCLAVLLALGATGAHAGCLTKGAVATAESEKSAKWYALETMVQAVSWGLWPSFLANGSVPGYTITNERYTCSPATLGVTCRGQATFCKTS